MFWWVRECHLCVKASLLSSEAQCFFAKNIVVFGDLFISVSREDCLCVLSISFLHTDSCFQLLYGSPVNFMFCFMCRIAQFSCIHFFLRLKEHPCQQIDQWYISIDFITCLRYTIVVRNPRKMSLRAHFIVVRTYTHIPVGKNILVSIWCLCAHCIVCFLVQLELDKKKGDKKGQKKKVKSKSSQRKAAKKNSMPHGSNDLTSKLYSTMEKHRDVSSGS